MSDEKKCLECDLLFPKSNLIRGTKTNAYGDKVRQGYICKNCFRIRIKRRLLILLAFAIGFSILAVGSFGISIYLYLSSTTLLAEDFFSTIETFNQLGLIFSLFAAGTFYLRYREKIKMKATLRNSRSDSLL